MPTTYDLTTWDAADPTIRIHAVRTCPDEYGRKWLVPMDNIQYDRFKFKRSLSHREIVECEWALKPKCVCRCAGEFHGARRLPENAGVSQYEALPTTDPHRLQPKPEREADAKIRRYHRRFHARAYDHWTHPEQNLAWPIRRAFVNGVGTPVEWCPICVIEGRAAQVAE